MKVTDIKQNTWAWHQARMIRPTASEFDKIITPGGKASESRIRYIYEIIFQRIYKTYATDRTPTEWMLRGQKLEPEAAKKFEELTGRSLVRGKFLLSNDGTIGCSPDGIITDGWACVEIKVPEPWKHILYTNEGPLKDYKAQIFGQMLVGEFTKSYFFSYCPGMPCKVHEIEINTEAKEYMEEMDKLLKKFVKDLDVKEQIARGLGNYGPIHEAT